MLFPAPRLKPGAIFGDMTCLAAREFEFGQHPKVTTWVAEREGAVLFLETASVFDDDSSRFLDDAKRCRGPSAGARSRSPHFRDVIRAGVCGDVLFLCRKFHAGASAAHMDSLQSRGAFPEGVVEAVFDQALTLVEDFEPGAGNLELGLHDLVLGWDGVLSFSRRTDWFAHAFLEDAFRDLGGKTWFLSPEELSGNATGETTSTWHAAALTYRLLTAHGPFRDESDFETMHNIIEVGRPPLPAPWMTGPVSKCISRAFERDVDARPTPTQLRRDLAGQTMSKRDLGRFFSSAFSDEFDRQQELQEQAGLGEIVVVDEVTEFF